MRGHRALMTDFAFFEQGRESLLFGKRLVERGSPAVQQLPRLPLLPEQREPVFLRERLPKLRSERRHAGPPRRHARPPPAGERPRVCRARS